MKYFRPYPRMNTCRRKRRTRCTPNLRQTSDILTEVHTNVTEAILGGFIACLSRLDTTIPFRCSKSARLRPPGDETDAFGQQDDHRTSAKPLKSLLRSMTTKRWQSTPVSSHLYRELALPTRPDPQNLLVDDLRELCSIHLGNKMTAKPQLKLQYLGLGPYPRTESIP